MATSWKKVTEITLRNGEKVHVPLAEGESARRVKAKGSGAIMFPSLNNRMIDVMNMFDINDKSVEDHQTTMVQSREDRLLDQAKPIKVSTTSPGYIKFLVASRKFGRRFGSQSRIKLTPEQEKLVLAEEKRQGFV